MTHEAIREPIDSGLKERTMRQVRRIWFFRRVAPLLAVELVLLAGVAGGVLTQVSLRNVLLNALGSSADAWAFAKFFISNFFVKSIQSQLLVAVYAVLMAFFVRDLRSSFKRFGAGREELTAAFILTGRDRRLLS